MAYIQDINLISTSNQKIVKDYSFDASEKLVTINEQYDEVLYIYCKDTNQMIYNPAAKGFGGNLNAGVILLDYDVTTYEDFYNLIIVVEKKEADFTQQILNEILHEQKLTNKLLRKIYNPE